ncbi:MAG: hypothetical protein U0V64_04440 [Cyclobacteriaceae bacterium]
MTLETYLADKKIDADSFRLNDPERYNEWSVLIAKLHPASFTSQKLYLINKIRRQFPALTRQNEPKHV